MKISNAPKRKSRCRQAKKMLQWLKNKARNDFISAALCEMNRKYSQSEKEELIRFKSVMQDIANFCEAENEAARVNALQLN